MNRLLVSSTRRVVSGSARPWMNHTNGRSSNGVVVAHYFSSATTASTDNNDQSTDKTNTTSSNNSNKNSLSEYRTSLLRAALLEVHDHGWTDDALAAAAMSLKQQQRSGSSSSSSSMSVVGMMTVDDLIGFCMDEMNGQLRIDLNERRNQNQNQSSSEQQSSSQTTTASTTAAKQSVYTRLESSPSSSNTTNPNPNTTGRMIDPLEEGLKLRLEYLIPYLKSGRWHEGMALGMRGPSNALQTRQQLQDLIDIISFHGDSSVAPSNSNSHSNSHSNYSNTSLSTPTKMALGAVYVATELHLLTDASPGYHDTWTFLSSRMDDWRQLASFAGSSGSSGSTSTGLPAASDAFFVASSVASSLFGGALSLVLNSPSSSNNNKLASLSSSTGLFGLPQEVLASLFQHPSGAAGHWDSNNNANSDSDNNKPNGTTMDGTHPNHYDAPKRS